MMFWALVDRFDLAEKRWDFRLGIIGATVANCAPFVQRKKAILPHDLYPRIAPPTQTQTEAEMWKAVATIHRNLTGEKVEA